MTDRTRTYRRVSERGGPFIGEEPTSGLRGADDGVQLYAVFGPVEHQASLTSEMAIALDLKFQVEYRMVGRIYFLGSAWAMCLRIACISTEKGKLP